MRFIACFVFLQLIHGECIAQLAFRANVSSCSIRFSVKSDICFGSKLLKSQPTPINQFKSYWFPFNSYQTNVVVSNKLPSRSVLVTNFESEKMAAIFSDFDYKLSVPTVSTLLYLPSLKYPEYDNFKDKIRNRTYISSALFLSTAVTGYWLSNSSTPPNTFLLTVHKLTSISNLVLLDVTAYQKNKKFGLKPSEKLAMITMNICFVSTIATGGLLSTGKDIPRMVHTAHSITPWITIVSSGIMLYLMNNYK